MSPLQALGSIGRCGDQPGLSALDPRYVLGYRDGWSSLGLIGIVWFTRKPAPSEHVVAAD